MGLLVRTAGVVPGGVVSLATAPTPALLARCGRGEADGAGVARLHAARTTNTSVLMPSARGSAPVLQGRRTPLARLRERGRGEGLPRLPDRFQHRSGVLQHLTVPEPQHFKTQLTKTLITSFAYLA